MKLAVAIPLIFIIFISACVEQQPITEITLPGHPVYSFSNDVRESVQVRANDADTIRSLILQARRLTVVFDGSSEKDNGSFQVVAFNIITKLQTYFLWEGGVLNVDSYYYINDTWFTRINETDTEISRPDFSTLTNPVIWLKGPNTGANETSVIIDGNIITAQGLSHKDLTLAGDKLVLVVFGIERV